MELTLDDSADAAVRSDWDRLIRARLPSQGRHTGPTNRPHITLALTATVTDPVQRRLAAVANGLPVAVTVGALLVFGSRRFILCRLIVPDRALLDLQQEVVGALERPVDAHGTFRAGRWTPHVTLGRRFTADQLGTALTTLGGVRTVHGAASRIRVWDMTAHVESWPGTS